MKLKINLQTVLLQLLVCCCFFYSSSACAIDFNLGTMLTNLAKTVPQLMRLVTALAYVLGMFFILVGIGKLKQYGESRTMMSQEHHLKEPLIYLAVGTMLLYLPTSVWSGLYTFWKNPAPYSYLTQAEDPWGELVKNSFRIIQLIGTIAFVRGLIILSHLGGHGAQQGTFGKGLAHIIGGILCINIYQFIQAVLNTLAFGQV